MSRPDDYLHGQITCWGWERERVGERSWREYLEAEKARLATKGICTEIVEREASYIKRGESTKKIILTLKRKDTSNEPTVANGSDE